MRNRKESAGAADVAVVGAGVVGLAVAREAARRGLSVIIIERGRAGAEASHAAGGMLAPQAEADCADEFFRLQCAGRDFYPDFAASLAEETGLDIELDRTGTLYLALCDEDEEELEKRYRWQTRAGLAVERLTAREARGREPNLSEQVRFALRFPLDWQVENRKLVAALAASAKKHGALVWEGTEALGVRVERGRACGVETSRGFVYAGAVVLAAGAWSSHVPFVGDESSRSADAPQCSHPRVEPVRGQMLAFEYVSFLPLFRHVVYSPRGYVVPRRASRVLAGSTTEHAGFDKQVTGGGVRAILENALEIAPALGGLRVADMWAGLRPRAEDDWPVIGESEDARRLFYATGHYRNGILLAPLTGALVADMIEGRAARVSHVEAFGPGRFRRAAV